MMDQNERSAAIQIGGGNYELLLATKTTKENAKRYGGGEKHRPQTVKNGKIYEGGGGKNLAGGPHGKKKNFFF